MPFMMKHIPLLLVLGSTFLAVEEADAQRKPAVDASAKRQVSSSGYWEKLTMQPFFNAQGQMVVEMPLPSTWQLNRKPQQGQPTLIGPHDTKVFDFPSQTFMSAKDPSLRQIYQKTGQRMRPMPGIGAVIEQDLVPWCANQGLRFIRHYEIPELSKIDQWYSDQLYKAVPGPARAVAIGSDWENAKGDPHFIVMHLTVGETRELQTWSYWCSGLQAEKAHFQTAKKQLIFALAYARYNPQQIMAFNQSEAQKAGQSWAAHNKRMAANQAAFEASQRAHVNRSNAINEAIMSGWRERNAVSDRAQERFVDTINERTNVVDPSTGQKYKVDSGSNHYWMNRDGKYVSTDHSTYDPNLDDAMNRENWQKLEPVK